MGKFVTMALVVALLMGGLYGACSWDATDSEPEDPTPVTPSPHLPDEEEDEDETTAGPPWPTERALPTALLVSYGNNPQARPQTGLEQADLVYEVLAEGGITRLMGLFNTYAPEEIGPIRSMRQCLVEIAMGHDSPFAHAGGSMEALASIRRLNAKSLDEIYGAGNYFWRSSQRRPPDNLYTSAEKLLAGATARGFGETPLPEFPSGRLSGGETATTVVVDYSRSTAFPNRISYTWEDGLYWREINHSPHISTSSGDQLAPHNLLFLETTTREFVRDGDPMVEIDVIGQGAALLFRDGQSYQASWKKTDINGPFTFTLTASGEPLKLTPGQVWIHLVPSLDYVKVDED